MSSRIRSRTTRTLKSETMNTDRRNKLQKQQFKIFKNELQVSESLGDADVCLFQYTNLTSSQRWLISFSAENILGCSIGPILQPRDYSSLESYYLTEKL